MISLCCQLLPYLLVHYNAHDVEFLSSEPIWEAGDDRYETNPWMPDRGHPELSKDDNSFPTLVR